MDAVAPVPPPGWLDRDRPWSLALALVVNGAVIAWISVAVLGGFPVSADEYGYLHLAERLAEGRLHLESLEPRASFATMHFVNDGRYYAKYPPGWPAVLAVGAWCGIPLVVNPLVGLASLVVLWHLARRLVGIRGAHLAVLLSLGCPFFAFAGASLFSHATSLLAALVLTDALDRLRLGQRGAGATLGLAAGLAFATRPYTAVALAAIPASALFARDLVRRDGRALAAWARGLPAMIVLGGAFLAYNAAQTGDPLRLPFQVYDPTEGLDAKLLDSSTAYAAWDERVARRVVSLARWTGGLPILALVGWAVWARERRRWLLLAIALPPIALVLGYAFYASSGGFQYGPRYVYEGYAFLAIAGGAALARARRVSVVVLALVVGANAVQLARAAAFYRTQAAERAAFFREVRSPVQDGRLILLRTGVGSMPMVDMVRNDPHQPRAALIALDLGREANRELLARHPDRSPFVYEFEPTTRTGSFRPYDPTEPPAVRLERQARYRIDFWREPRNLE